MGPLPLWLKLAHTLFCVVLIPVYTLSYGWRNFLWFSDIALLATLIGLWLESRLLISMMALAVLLPELAWNVDFWGRLLLGHHVSGQTDYMFDPKIPLLVRLLSLFHLALPVLLVWLVSRLGYDSRSLWAQTLLGWAVLLATYLLTDPSQNINWVFGLGQTPQTRIPAPLYLALAMLGYPLLVYLPTHLLLRWLWGSR